MCGIAGFFTSRPLSPADIATALEPMVRSIAHRGPDQQGIWSSPDGTFGLGFRRLAVVDLTVEGHQPMRSESGRFVIAFNGEVYNFRSLRAELAAHGHQFRGTSDTEVMLAAFEEWGVEGALRRFNGMFAFALWDTLEQTLVLARDRVGIKPLYVFRQPGFVSFASELKALAVGPAFDRSVEPMALGLYLRHAYVPAPATIYRNTIKLLPGCYLAIRSADRELPAPSPYWSLDDVCIHGGRDPIHSDQEAVEQLEQLLLDAVKLQMVSDVALGALLSGGVDSSVVVALMRELGQERVKTYTIGFDDDNFDESAPAARVAEHFGTDHTSLRLSGAEALDVVPLLPTMFDEPHADPSQIPTYLVSKLARAHVTVALSGDGGDELFAGYNRYRFGARTISTLRKLPNGSRRLARGALGLLSADAWAAVHGSLSRIAPAIVPQPGLISSKVAKLEQLMGGSTEADMYMSLMSYGWQRPAEVLSMPLAIDGADRAYQIMAGGEPPGLVERMMLADQATYLPDDLLAKVDRASMAISLEARVPLLDHRVVELSWRMSRTAKLRRDVTKWALREVLYRRIPKALIERPKKGFSVPLEAWLRGPLRDWAEDLLSEKSLGQTGLLNASPIRALWQRVKAGEAQASAIWTVLVFQDWARRWTAPPPRG